MTREPTAVLMLTHDVEGEPWLPHLRHLQASNPGAAVHVASDADSDRERAWRNGDRKLRNWWREHGREVAGEVIAILEWDVLVTCDLPALPPGADIASKTVITRESEPGWPWFREARRVGRLVPKALAPLAVMVAHRKVLDDLVDERWDEIYSRDIFCELRLGSVLGTWYRLGELELPGVRWYPVRAGRKPGIYHAVKQAVD